MESSQEFPAVDAQKQLNPGIDKDFQADAVSSEVATSKEIKEKYEAGEKRKEEERKDMAMQNFKTAVIVSGVVVAVAGALLAITKKIREK